MGNNQCKVKLTLITKQPEESALWKALYAINCTHTNFAKMHDNILIARMEVIGN